MVFSVSRSQALAFRQRAVYLDQRLPRGSLAEAAFAGLQDSAPRSAVLALHVRVRDVVSSAWEDSQLVQVWGPRGAVYVVPRKDVAVFTVGRLPRESSRRSKLEAAVKRVERALLPIGAGKRRAPTTLSRQYLHDLRVASITGRIQIRWDGSRIAWWAVDPPQGEAEPARLELARRFLRSLGPSTTAGFAWWSGGTLPDAQLTFRSLIEELLGVNLGNRRCWALKASISALEQTPPSPTVRLLPAGDPYLGAADRELLVPEARFRAQLWPKSVWPGAFFIRGELAGTWRRQQGRVVAHPWRPISTKDKEAVTREVETMPIDSATKEVRWERPLKPSSR